MKKSIVTMLVLLWLLSTLVVANVLLPKWQSKSTSDKQVKPADNKPEISKYGNLLKWSGKSFHNEGYELRYEYTNLRTRKKEEKLVSAFGNGTTTGLLPIAPEKNPSDADAIKVSMKTKDGVLLLTRLFITRERTKELEVWLVVRNDFSHPVIRPFGNSRGSGGIGALPEGQTIENIGARFMDSLITTRIPKEPFAQNDVAVQGVTFRAKCTDPSCNCPMTCPELTSALGTDCQPEICPPPRVFEKDFNPAFRPTVRISEASSPGKPTTVTWSVGKNAPLRVLQGGQAIAFGYRTIAP